MSVDKKDRSDLKDINTDLISLLWDSHERLFYLPKINFTEEELQQISDAIKRFEKKELDIHWEIIEPLSLRWEILNLYVENDPNWSGAQQRQVKSDKVNFTFDTWPELFHRKIRANSKLSWSEILYIWEKLGHCLTNKLWREFDTLFLHTSQYDVALRAMRNWFVVKNEKSKYNTLEWVGTDRIENRENYYIDSDTPRYVRWNDDLINCIINKKTEEPIRFTMIKKFEL